VIPMDANGKLSDAFNIRLDELRVIDIKFLHGCAKPTICLLYEDHRGARHVKTYVILAKEKEFAEGPWSQSHVEAGASLLIPVPSPFGGVLIVSQQMIVYHNGSACHAISMQSTVIQVYGQVDRDGSRFLLADQFGLLQVVVLTHSGKDVSGIALEVLGDTSIASTLSYLDNGVKRYDTI
jgi:DNA damage-binding protein 1